MYYEHFGLNYPPFKITPDTQLFYSGGNRGLILDALVYAVENGEGIIKVVGEVGSGKTMLCRMLEQKLSKRVEIIYIANPRLPPDMILHAIAIEMRLPIKPDSNRLQVMHALHNKLLEKHACNQQVVMFIEEAQEMPLETLEEIRLLSNLETSRNKLLQIVLFGQPELDVNLSATHIRQLKERITHNFYLPALTRHDIDHYLQFRMSAVGYRGVPVFSKGAVRHLATISQGLLRRINILADKALLAAYADDVYQVTTKHARLAARDCGFAEAWYVKPVNTYATIGLLSIGTILLISWLYPLKQDIFGKFSNNSEIATVTSASSITVTDPLLQERWQITQRWLAETNPRYYSIQIVQATEDKVEELAKILRKPDIQPLLEHLYVYRANNKGQITWGIVYADFPDTVSAMQAMTNLPASIQRNRPFLRTIANLRDKTSGN